MKLDDLVCIAKDYDAAHDDRRDGEIWLYMICVAHGSKPEILIDQEQISELFPDYTVTRVLNDDGTVYYYKRIAEYKDCIFEGIIYENELTLKDRTILGLPGEEF